MTRIVATMIRIVDGSEGWIVNAPRHTTFSAMRASSELLANKLSWAVELPTSFNNPSRRDLARCLSVGRSTDMGTLLTMGHSTCYIES